MHESVVAFVGIDINWPRLNLRWRFRFVRPGSWVTDAGCDTDLSRRRRRSSRAEWQQWVRLHCLLVTLPGHKARDVWCVCVGGGGGASKSEWNETVTYLSSTRPRCWGLSLSAPKRNSYASRSKRRKTKTFPWTVFGIREIIYLFLASVAQWILSWLSVCEVMG